MAAGPGPAARAAAAAIAALLLGGLFVGCYDTALGRSRYPYAADSASYLEMAQSLHEDGRPRVTPWDVEPGDRDAVPQPLFPPGFAALVAPLIPITGDARTALLIPGRLAAALLPCLLVLLWRGVASPGVLLALGAWVLLSPGVREWQFLAYSDVTALALAVLSLGALARPLLARDPPARASSGWWLAAGFTAGLCYAVRNAGLALLIASAATLVYARLRHYLEWRALRLWALGAAPPLGVLIAYNLATFGRLQPYAMPPSTRPWRQNLADYAMVQLDDLGLPRALAATLPGAALIASLALLLGAAALAWWRCRDDRPRHALLTLLGCYVLSGAVLLIAARSRYEWPDNIDWRNVLQYSFALALALLCAARVLLPPRVQRMAGWLLLAALGLQSVAVAREALAAREAPLEPWLVLSRDPAVIAAVRALPPATLIASNAAPLLRIAATRSVRQLDLRGDDHDFTTALGRLTDAAGSRPAQFVLVCDETTRNLSACRGEATASQAAGRSPAPACLRLRAAAPIVARCLPQPHPIASGLGAYYREPRRSATGPEVALPVAKYRRGAALAAAAPTNQWYSSVMFQRWSQPLYALPLTYRATQAGFELGLPHRELAVLEGGSRVEVRYLHRAAMTVAPLAFAPRDARLAGFSDWLARIDLGGEGAQALTATVLHGSPFSYYELSQGDAGFALAEPPRILSDPRAAGHDPRVAAFAVDGHAYAIFAPRGASWDWSQPARLVLHLPRGARYFSVAGLPDESGATLRQFLALAYAFPTTTRADWAYEPRSGIVRTTFHVDTVAREGVNRSTLMGLYPHQWAAVTPRPPVGAAYESVRGPIRLVSGNAFTVERRYHGTLPCWSGLREPAHAALLEPLLARDAAAAPQLLPADPQAGTYAWGKALGALTQLLCVAEAEGRAPLREALLAVLERGLEQWFDGRHAGYFLRDAQLGTFVGLPEEFHSASNMNDHHFHDGYWINAAAQVALRDPAWASRQHWGGMIDLLVADIATAGRGRGDFPFLRNFDSYEGHSWASGTAEYPAGNNQESSSEAIHAWAGLILLGEARGDARLRDLGIYLYTSEIAAARQYWFDPDREVLAPQFTRPLASLVFGGKYAWNTWWTHEPRQVAGINLLPITPAATYLGADPAYVRRLLESIPQAVQDYRAQGATDGTPEDIWQDILASYLALADPAAGLARWNPAGDVQEGETRAHTLYWLLSLAEMGTPDFSVTADTPLHAVFRSAAGVRTYLAYNAGATPIRVRFSTARLLAVGPHSLARASGD